MDTVGDLRKALEDVPDDMELVVGIDGNQHGVYGCGLAKCGNDGLYKMLEPDEVWEDDDEINFYIDG